MKALVNRIIRGPDGTEYRLVPGQEAPDLPERLAKQLTRAGYLEAPLEPEQKPKRGKESKRLPNGSSSSSKEQEG